MRRAAPVIGLLVLAPLVAEYLLGNIPPRMLPALPFLVPMYGGGALLIREAARRTGRGWAAILVLGAAYGLVEAAMFDGSLFNPSFDGLDLSGAYLPVLGISASNAMHFVVGHAVWSITIPIVLVEASVPDRRDTPWLGYPGLAVTAAGYLLGGLLIQHDTRQSGDFRTSPAQFAGAAAVTVALVAVAFALPRPGPAGRVPGRVPRPLLVALAGFAVSSLFFATPESWAGLAAGLAVLAGAAPVLRWLSRRAGWRYAHRVALAGGVMLTYAWGAFALAAIRGNTGTPDVAGNALLGAGAVVLAVVATRRAATTGPPATPAAS